LFRAFGWLAERPKLRFLRRPGFPVFI
jgi:hypothetical protein